MSNYIIQSILLPTDVYSVKEAKQWVVDHGYIVRKVHTTRDYHRIRQHTPNYAKSKGCINVKTIPIGNDGIKFIVYYCEDLAGGNIISTAKSLIYGRSDYPDVQKKMIERYGGTAITGIKIGRTPLPSLIKYAINLVSLGSFQKLLKQSPYDKLYHLFCIVTLETGTKIILEKNEAINMKTVTSYNPKNTQYEEATYIPSGLTFKELLDNGQKIQGKKWFVYNAVSNNCQDYIIALLKGSSILTKQLQDFIKQDVKTLFETLPGTKKVMDVVTGIGNKIDIIKKGGKLEYHY